jgi:DNA-binding NarL/FixJ family response regulator
MSKTRVLLIEDNRLLREGIAAMLDAQDDFEVVAVAEDGDAIDQLTVLEQLPEIVLLDLALEKADSIRLISTIQSRLPSARIIAMDILPEQTDVVEIVKAGASGFILKSASVEEYVDAIRAVARGEKVLPAVLTASLFTQIVDAAFESNQRALESAIQLTEREREVVDLVADGLGHACRLLHMPEAGSRSDQRLRPRPDPSKGLVRNSSLRAMVHGRCLP